MYELTDVKNGTELADAISELTVQPTVHKFFGARSGDILPALMIAGESAGSLGDSAPTIRLTGARSVKADTAADALLKDALAVDGGALRIIPVTVTMQDNGRTRDNASAIAAALDKAFLRLTESDRLRLVYGQASDRIEDVTVYGVNVKAKVPGMFYVMATGGAVKSDPILGKFYRAIAGAR